MESQKQKQKPKTINKEYCFSIFSAFRILIEINDKSTKFNKTTGEKRNYSAQLFVFKHRMRNV